MGKLKAKAKAEAVQAGAGPSGRGRHTPERTCVACRQTRPQAELLRLTRGPAGWALDTPGTPRRGRGSYLCADSPGCWAEKRLRRTFGAAAPGLAELLRLRATAAPAPAATEPPPADLPPHCPEPCAPSPEAPKS